MDFGREGLKSLFIIPLFYIPEITIGAINFFYQKSFALEKKVRTFVSDHLLTFMIVTLKKDQILQTALRLFADEGYQNTSTSKIACGAGVSEGLIFKHFKCKEGLLQAVINLLNEEIKDYIELLRSQDDPKKVIETAFEFPPLVSSNQEFWKLQFSLKYQCPHKKKYHEKKELMAAAQTMLEDAFTELGYENPEMETELLMSIIYNMCEANAEGGCQKEYMDFVKQKYAI